MAEIPPRVLTPEATGAIIATLSARNRDVQRLYPGESGRRQPVHVVYGGAHLFRADTAARLGATALRVLDEYAADPAEFARAVGLPEDRAASIHDRVRRKL